MALIMFGEVQQLGTSWYESLTAVDYEVYCLPLASLLNPEDGAYTFVRNVCGLLLDHTAIYLIITMFTKLSITQSQVTNVLTFLLTNLPSLRSTLIAADQILHAKQYYV
jgi:hypothetical protein